jgi:long-chain fatty acid transport protein
VALALAAGLRAQPARAGGFAIFEQGARGMGLAGAYVAQSDDASAVFHNAAGIAFLKGRQLYFGATLIHPKTDFQGAAPFPGEGVSERSAAGVLMPPAFDYSQSLSQRLVLGFGVHVPYGLRTRWAERETSYSGRFIAKSADVWSYSFNPTLAYKLADRLAVGGGLDVRLSRFGLERNVALFNPFTQRVQDVAALRMTSRNQVALGWNVGVLAKPTENLAVGVSYRHKVRTNFSGDAELALLATGSSQFDALVGQRLAAGVLPAATEIEFPAQISLGIQYSWGDWLFAADVDLQQWSSFDVLPLRFAGRPDLSEVVPENYKSAQTFRAGAERRWSDTWTFRGGYFFDRTPAPVESLSPMLSDASRHGAALGASWRRGRLRVEAAHWLVFSRERSTEGRSLANYNGTYKSFDALVSLSLGVSF